MKAASAILAGLAMTLGGAAPAEEPAPGFVLGVQTHFQQGWPTRLIGEAKRLGAPAVRDELSWSRVEEVKGFYDFSEADHYMRPLIEIGLTPLIVMTDDNRHYDYGKTPYSEDGIAGLAGYISAIFAHYGVGNIQIEIGNEVNSDDFVSGPFVRDKPGKLAETVRAVSDRLDRDHPDAQIICTGLNTIAMGFLRAFFQKGGLQACDGISVHPYRDNPDTVMMELDRLKDLMREFGGEKPIHVTEFGKWFDDAGEAPDYMVKMVAQMAAVGVREAYWYALIDEPWWPNMGLLEKDGVTAKPAEDAFLLLQSRLLPLGPVRSRSDVPTVRLFEFGTGGRGFVAWGSGARLHVEGQADYVDTRGRPIAPVAQLSDRPVILFGEGLRVSVEDPQVVADTKYQFSQPPWSYLALLPWGELTTLEMMDWNWTSYRGAPDLRPLQIGDKWITTARFQGEPYHAIERFTAPRGGAYRVEGWWQASPKTERSRLIIRHNGEVVLDVPKITPERFSLGGLSVMLDAGDTLDFELAPTGPDGDGSVQRRIRVFGPPSSG
ncbi:hypothetical protein [Ruegeria marina]|uniref:Glycosyl hydrolase catalytic core n=1 Tax=Ruegeria marina TaxID=639004 RepID=A0A1G6IDF9_9RHOB|nr:hypothetical protein [Ruegeria marina]SDC03766.1 hypothetical protein SAMN04488239_10176 [Ruegeria marina]